MVTRNFTHLGMQLPTEFHPHVSPLLEGEEVVGFLRIQGWWTTALQTVLADARDGWD